MVEALKRLKSQLRLHTIDTNRIVDRLAAMAPRSGRDTPTLGHGTNRFAS
jgi:hypothetical protein